MVHAIAIDIDGTLLDSRGQLPAANRAAVVDASKRGVEVALVTGRSFHFARPVADLLPIPLTLIVNNGAAVKNKAGITEMRHVLPRDVARGILIETAGHEEDVAIVFDRDDVDDRRQIVFERMDWTHPNRKGYYERNKAFIDVSNGPLADALTDDPIQVMFNGSVAPMRALAATLRSTSVAPRISVAITEYERRDFALVDVNGAGCSKGSALEKWTRARGWPPDAIAAIGDNLNDVQMLDFAGRSFLMGNAADALKARATERGYRIVESNDDGGLASAIAACVADTP